MTNKQDGSSRIVSGMRSTGNMHLGNYHGALQNWVELQDKHECFFFAADWHALTTHYEDTGNIAKNSFNLIIDWLAAGLDPKKSKIFVQSGIPEHAELHLLLSMVTPVTWLERVPTYKDQQQELKEKDLATYGFLGYPLLQSADVLIYRASLVPVGEDQVSHIELVREIARRFNYIYGRDQDFMQSVERGLSKLGKNLAKQFRGYMNDYQQQGSLESLNKGKDLLMSHGGIDDKERNCLQGNLMGTGKVILPEPQPLLTKITKFPGLDGRKMSKSYNNTIGLTEDKVSVTKKIETMPTDPARIKRTDPGDPEKCPVWDFHKVYSGKDKKDWVEKGCKSAGIGCLDCKRSLLEDLNLKLDPIREKSEYYKANPKVVNDIIEQGTQSAKLEAKATLSTVRAAMGIEQ